MLNWMKQKTTIAGILTAITAGLQAYQSGGDLVTVALAVVSALLLIVKDPKFLSGAGAILVIAIGASSQACATIPTPEIAKAGAGVACVALQASGCFDDMQDAFPGLNAGTCASVVGAAIDAAVIIQRNFATMPRDDAAVKSVEPLLSIADTVSSQNWDPLKVRPERIGTNSSCMKIANALGVK